MKDKWRNYALKDGKIKQSYLRERQDGDKKWQTSKASSSNSIEQSRKEQQEIGIQNERIRKEEPSQTHQEGQQGIQGSTERRCSVEETNTKIKTREEKVKKESLKHKKHEASESKSFEKKEDRKEAKKEAKPSPKKK